MVSSTATPAATPSALPEQARCLKCGYLLRGLTEPRCPECGRAFDLEDRKSYALRKPPPWLLQFSVVMLSRFVFWGAIALVLLAAAASALPGLWIPAVLVGFLGTLSVVLGWFVLLALAGLAQRFYDRGPATGCRRALVAPFACAALCLLLLSTEALSHLTLAVSKPAMNRLAAEALQVPPGTGLTDRRLGLFPARSIQTFAGGCRFKVGGSGFTDSYGYAFSRDGPPPVIGDDEYTPLGNGWYRWVERF